MAIRLYVRAEETILEIIAGAPAGGARQVREIWDAYAIATYGKNDNDGVYDLWQSAWRSTVKLGPWASWLFEITKGNGFGRCKTPCNLDECCGGTTEPQAMTEVLDRQRPYADDSFTSEVMCSEYLAMIDRAQTFAHNSKIELYWC